MDTIEQGAAEAKAPLVSLKIAAPDDQIVTEAMTVIAYAETFTIVTDADSVKAQEARSRISTKIDSLEEARKLLTRPIDAAKKTIMAFFGGPQEKMERAKSILDAKILTYKRQQDAIRAEAQRKADEAAAAKRRELEAKAAEAKRKADAEAEAKRKEAEAAAAAGRAAEAAKLQAQAARIEEKAEAKVEDLTSRAAQVVAPTLVSAPAKAAGSQFRDNWKWRIKDAKAVKPDYLAPDEEKISRVVKALKGDAADVIGGIEVYNEPILATRRA